jgi:hypothetical protein
MALGPEAYRYIVNSWRIFQQKKSCLPYIGKAIGKISLAGSGWGRGGWDVFGAILRSKRGSAKKRNLDAIFVSCWWSRRDFFVIDRVCDFSFKRGILDDLFPR